MIKGVSLPICVDLDGTLVRDDTLWILMRLLVKQRPFFFVQLLWIFLLRGRAAFKKILSQNISLDPARLSYHKKLLQDLSLCSQQKEKLVLVTGADLHLAQKIANHLGIFHMVLASNGSQNLVGHAKGCVLANTFGVGQFIYVGNSWQDIPVWDLAAHMIAVNAPKRLLKTLKKKITSQKQLKVYE